MSRRELSDPEKKLSDHQQRVLFNHATVDVNFAITKQGSKDESNAEEFALFRRLETLQRSMMELGANLLATTTTLGALRRAVDSHVLDDIRRRRRRRRGFRRRRFGRELARVVVLVQVEVLPVVHDAS